MSPLGTKRRCRQPAATSAVEGKAAVHRRRQSAEVRRPKGDALRRRKSCLGGMRPR
jgi:hypothetical protein